MATTKKTGKSAFDKTVKAAINRETSAVKKSGSKAYERKPFSILR